MICIILGGYTTFNGLDISNKTSYLIFLITFIFGFLFGFGLRSLAGGTILNRIDTGLALGFIVSFAILFQGVVMKYHLRHSLPRDDKIKLLFLKLKKREKKNLFDRFIEKFLEKFV